MAGRTLCACLFMLVLFVAASGFAAYTYPEGGWTLVGITTWDFTDMGWPPPYCYVDGRIYNNDGSLVQDGSLLQIVIGRDGADIVDPLDYFDVNDNGVIDEDERTALALWVRSGADPSDISGGTNKLATGSWGCTGEWATAGGRVEWTPGPGEDPVMDYGHCQDKIAWRAWSLTKEELLNWCDLENHPEMLGIELWYTDGREYFTHENNGGGPDTGWWVGMEDLQRDDDPTTWTGFYGSVGGEIYAYYVDGEPTARSENRLDHYLGYCLGECVPEPGTILLVGTGLLLFAAPRARKRSQTTQ